jgi:hypothetical protein
MTFKDTAQHVGGFAGVLQMAVARGEDRCPARRAEAAGNLLLNIVMCRSRWASLLSNSTVKFAKNRNTAAA